MLFTATSVLPAHAIGHGIFELVDDDDTLIGALGADPLRGRGGSDTLIRSQFLGTNDVKSDDSWIDAFSILVDQSRDSSQRLTLINDHVVHDSTTPVITGIADANDAVISIGDTLLAHVTGTSAILTTAKVVIISASTVETLNLNT